MVNDMCIFISNDTEMKYTRSSATFRMVRQSLKKQKFHAKPLIFTDPGVKCEVSPNAMIASVRQSVTLVGHEQMIAASAIIASLIGIAGSTAVRRHLNDCIFELTIKILSMSRSYKAIKQNYLK
jgi:hypothetical protein